MSMAFDWQGVLVLGVAELCGDYIAGTVRAWEQKAKCERGKRRRTSPSIQAVAGTEALHQSSLIRMTLVYWTR